MGGEVKLVFLQKQGELWEFKTEPHERFDAFLSDLMHVSRFGLRRIRPASGPGPYVLSDYYEISDKGMWFLRPHFANWDEMEAQVYRRRYDDGIHINFEASGDFYEHIFRTYSGFGKQTTTGTVPPVLPYAVREACTLLGLATNTRPDIRGAFRAKVREAADGHGGYTGDMDRLTKAKEQLLSFVGKG